MSTPIIHKQKMRFIVDVEVSVRDLPKALIDETEIISHYEKWKAENKKDFTDYMGFQDRILHAVLKTPEILLPLLIEAAGNKAADDLVETYHSDHGPSTKEQLLPFLDGLTKEDKNALQEAIKNEVLSENTETALFESFEAIIIESTVELIEE